MQHDELIAKDLRPYTDESAPAEEDGEKGPPPATEATEVKEETSSRWRRFSFPALAVAGALGGLEIARARFQHGHLFAPTRYPSGDWDPGRHGLPFRDVWLASEDGTRLHGWWFETPRSRATVLYCHGNAGSIGDRIEIFANLRRLRVNVFAFDYRGFGKSDGKPSEQGLFADARAAVDYVTGELGVDPTQLLLFGHSLGGAVAIDAAHNRQVAGLVVQSSFTDIASMARHLYTHYVMHWIARNQFRSIDKVPEITCPKLFIHGDCDDAIPIEMGRQLYAAAAGPKAWFPVKGAQHNDLYVQGGKAYFRVLSRFRKRCVR
jgi:pimeloyl-ACP methyl ester carboxylesterase